MSGHVRSSSARELARSIEGLEPKKSDIAAGSNYGEVTNVDDPKKEGRIKVRLEYMPKDMESDWIVPQGGFQGKGFGSTFNFPMVGDKVRLEFFSGNIHNMMWLPSWYHSEEKSSITNSSEVKTPLGFSDDGRYDATARKRRNILRTFSNWIIDLIEGTDVISKWRMFIQSPTKRDHIKWYAPLSEETGRKFSVWEIKIDDYFRLFDDLNSGKSEIIWDSFNKKIYTHIHPSGNYKIEDHQGGYIEMDEPTGRMRYQMNRMPASFFDILDNSGGYLKYSSLGEMNIKLALNYTLNSAMNITCSAVMNMNLAAGMVMTLAAPAIVLTTGADVLKLGAGLSSLTSHAPIFISSAQDTGIYGSKLEISAGTSVTVNGMSISISGPNINLSGSVNIIGDVNITGSLTVNGRLIV